MLKNRSVTTSTEAATVTWSSGFTQLFSGAMLWVMRLALGGVALYAVLTNLAGLGFRVALLTNGDAATLFRDNELWLGLRVGSSALVAMVYCTSGIVLGWYKSQFGFASLTALTLLTTAITIVDLSPALAANWIIHVHPVFSALNTALLLYLLLLFPDNRFRSKWLSILGHTWFVFCVASLLFPNLPFNVVYFDTWQRTPWPSLVVDFTPFIIAFVVLLKCLRQETRRVEYRQMQWFLIGTLTLFFGMLLNFTLRALPPGLGGTLNFEVIRPFALNLLMLMLPLSLGVAQYRYGLFGDEVVVKHTLNQLALAAILVGIYVLLVRSLEAFSVHYGSSLVIVVSATSIALLLQPLHSLIRRWLGRAMYGMRDDPQRVLSSLSGRLELSGDPEQALNEIGRTLEKVLQLPAGNIDIQLRETCRSIYHWGEQTENAILPITGTRLFPLVSDGEVVGRLWVTSQREQFSQEELDLLKEVARHAGRVMQSLKLHLELQLSRERRIETFEAKLKHLRNDLHDGIAPSLAGLVRHLDVALDFEGTEAEKQALLKAVQKGLLDSVGDLRRVIYGLRPPVLDELGLVGALREYVGGLPFRCMLDLPADLIISAATEVALFRITTEALNNIHKHAAAHEVCVCLKMDSRCIELKIEDDGHGFKSGKSGIGVASMRERAEELGGTLAIYSKAESGDLQISSLLSPGIPLGDLSGTLVVITLPFQSLQ